MKIRYYVTKDLKPQLDDFKHIEVENKEDFRDRIIALAKKRLRGYEKIYIRLFDVAYLIADGENAEEVLKRWTRTKSLFTAFETSILKRGKKDKYNGFVNKGFGTHMEIMSLLFFMQTKDFELYSMEEFIKLIKDNY